MYPIHEQNSIYIDNYLKKLSCFCLEKELFLTTKNTRKLIADFPPGGKFGISPDK